MSKKMIMDQLLEALKQNDVDSIRMFLSTNQEILLVAATTWVENPLVVALKYRSSDVADMITKQFPEFVQGKSKEGLTSLQLACENGDKAMVDALLETDPKLCLVKDGKSMIPLQAAAKKGYDQDIIRALITACPESIQKMTSKKETVFHLAVRNYRCNAFLILVEECKRLKLEHLLYGKDRQGNTVLHIATSNKLIRIVKLLLPPRSSGGSGCLVRVNSLNKRRLTALDIYYKNSDRDIATREIGNILGEAGAVEGCSLPTISRLRSYLETKNVILVVLGIVAGTVFTTVCNLPGSFLKDSPAAGAIFYARDVTSGHVPLIFYLMVFNTALLMVCMGAIIVLLWSLPFRAVVIFVTVTMGIVYALMMHSVMPKFFVRFGKGHDILSSVLVGVLAAAVICSAAIAHYMVKYTFLYLANLFNGSLIYCSHKKY